MRRKGGSALGGAGFARNRLTPFELELERLAEEGSNPLGIEPGRGAGLTDEGMGRVQFSPPVCHPHLALPQPRILTRALRRPWAVLVVSLLNAAMVYTHFLAMQRVEVAYMIAVKRTSLLFGILFGALFFHERGLAMHVLAGGMMLGDLFLVAW